MKNNILLSCVIAMCSVIASAQNNSLKLGVRLGGGISVSKEMGKVLVPED